MTDEEITEALVEASREQYDFSGWLAGVVSEAVKRRGGWENTERRTGSWEAGLVEQLVHGTIGYD